MTDKIRWDLFVQTGHRQRTEWASPSDGKDKKIYTSQNNNTVKKGSVQRSHMGSQFIHSEKNDILSPKEGRIQSVCVLSLMIKPKRQEQQQSQYCLLG